MTSSERSGSDSIKLLIIDPTQIGNGTATGELKATLFRDWATEQIAQIYGTGLDRVGFTGICHGKAIQSDNRRSQQLLHLARSFKPDCILYRPTPDNPALHHTAMKLIQSMPVPLITWIMDDWPERLRESDIKAHDTWAMDLGWLFRRSEHCLCISAAMKQAFEHRYGVDFLPIANGIDPEEWEKRSDRPTDTFVVRYAGSLAEDMTLHSVLMVASAIEALAEKGLQVRFEINTRTVWAKLHGRRFSRLTSCNISTEELSNVDYRKFLQGADALLIAYNFDERSIRYVRYSLANKLPECLISGNPLIVFGPAEVATVSYMHSRLPETVISTASEEVLENHLERLTSSPDLRSEIAQRCRDLALERFQLSMQQKILKNVISEASKQPYRREIKRYARSEHAQIDECKIIAALNDSSDAPERVMIDVGAHYGSSLKAFAERGWQILAFEPDQENRAVLEKRFGRHSNVHIDPKAVSDTEASSQAFYSSAVSTGIRGLLPFHESHHQANNVEVTSLDAVTAQREITRVDFLKIDVEGYDLAVLKGFPWDRLQPDTVICEFEDAKTLQLGHNWQDIADFLTARDYTVYVSEWYPILRYGIQHDWCSIREYPCELSDPSAWGNLVAFREAPSLSAIAPAIESAIKERGRAGRVPDLERLLRLSVSMARASLRRIRSRLS